MVLSLFSCAEVTSTTGIPLTLKDIPFDAMLQICFFLDDPFSTLGKLNLHFQKWFTTELSVKRIVKERFQIPELVTDDVDNNEEELKFIFLSFSKLAANPEDVYEALRHEFLHTNNINVLQINLVRYFCRYKSKKLDMKEMDVLIKHKKSDYVLQSGPELQKIIELSIFDAFEDNIRHFQEFIVANPEYLERGLIEFKGYAGVSIETIIRKWVLVALVSNMPEMIFQAFSRYPSPVFDPPTIWTEIHVPKSNYKKVFEICNHLIDNSFHKDNEAKTERLKGHYRLYNLVRFGTEEDLEVIEEQIRKENLSEPVLSILCRCASLSDNMALFHMLLPHFRSNIMKFPHFLNAPIRDDCLDMHKSVFDVYQYADDEFRQHIIDQTNFVLVLSKYYKVVYIKWNENMITFEFRISTDGTEFAFPEMVAVNQTYTSKSQLRDIPIKMKFDNETVLESFLLDLFNEYRPEVHNFSTGGSVFFGINPNNLSLIIHSESIRQMINYHIENLLIPRQSFVIYQSDFFKIDYKIDSNMADIVKIHPHTIINLTKIKTDRQFKMLEILKGASVSTLIRESCDPYKYLHVYKYLIENGKELPENISEKTRKLLRNDYPSLQI